MSAVKITLEINSVIELDALCQALEFFAECDGCRVREEPDPNPARQARALKRIDAAERLLKSITR
jgi:hypothetical protein